MYPTVLKRAGIRTLLYVDDLLTCCGTETEAFIAREIIAKTLEDAGITRSPTKGQWTPSQVLQDHLDNNVDSKGAGRLQLPEIWRLLDAMGTPTNHRSQRAKSGATWASRGPALHTRTAHPTLPGQHERGRLIDKIQLSQQAKCSISSPSTTSWTQRLVVEMRICGVSNRARNLKFLVTTSTTSSGATSRHRSI